MKWREFCAVVGLLLASLPCTAKPADCHLGTYRFADRTIVDVAPEAGATLRWRRFDGTTGSLVPEGKNWTSSYGWTGRPDGHVVSFDQCSTGRLHFDGAAGRKLEFDVTETKFVSHAATLVGRLVMPKGTAAVPIVVLVHGSEHYSAREFYALQHLLPTQGVGAFVYDKRGTGESGGAYSQEFPLPADDAVAAMREARRLAGSRAGRVGYQGGSQAGWVLPIAVNRAPVDFAIVCFGLAVSVIDEDRQEVEIEMREQGHSPAEIARALEVADAAETVFASGFTLGFAEFDALRAKYHDAPWYHDLHGNYTYVLLPYTEPELRAMSVKFRWGTPFYYDPMPVLRANTTPQLWILGGEDYEAPSAQTSQRIQSLIVAGRPFALGVYPQAEHGMTLFEVEGATGKRLSTRYAPHYFEMIRDFARDGELGDAYGDAKLMNPHALAEVRATP